MPRKESEAVPEGNDFIPLYIMPGGFTLKDFRQVMLKVWDMKIDKLTNDWIRAYHHLASLEHDARQPRPAMEADVQADKVTHESTVGAA